MEKRLKRQQSSEQQELTYSNINDENLLEPIAKALCCSKCGSDRVVGLSLEEPERVLKSGFVCVKATLNLSKCPQIISKSEEVAEYI